LGGRQGFTITSGSMAVSLLIMPGGPLFNFLLDFLEIEGKKSCQGAVEWSTEGPYKRGGSEEKMVCGGDDHQQL